MNKKDYTTISYITLLIFAILAIILAVYFFSQTDFSDFNFQSQAEDTEQTKDRENLKVEDFVINFIKRHPNWLNNDLASKETNKEFEEEVIAKLQDPNFLDEIPMKLVDVSDRGNKYTATFVSLTPDDGFNYNHPIDEINYEVIGEITKETAMKLKQDGTYNIKFSFIKTLTDSERENLMSEGRVRGKKSLKDNMIPFALPIAISAEGDFGYQGDPDHISVGLGTLLGKFIYIH